MTQASNDRPSDGSASAYLLRLLFLLSWGTQLVTEEHTEVSDTGRCFCISVKATVPLIPLLSFENRQPQFVDSTAHHLGERT